MEEAIKDFVVGNYVPKEQIWVQQGAASAALAMALLCELTHPPALHYTFETNQNLSLERDGGKLNLTGIFCPVLGAHFCLQNICAPIFVHERLCHLL